jgi:hypothetical protein
MAFLADAAQAQPDGKIYALGAGIDTIYAAKFPAVQPSLTVVVKIEFTPAECGRPHVIELLAVDGDGNPFLPPAKFENAPERNPQAPTLPVGVQLVLGLQNLVLPKPGEYAFSILVDGHELETIPLRAADLQLPRQA